jgi:hypothetical protein
LARITGGRGTGTSEGTARGREWTVAKMIHTPLQVQTKSRAIGGVLYVTTTATERAVKATSSIFYIAHPYALEKPPKLRFNCIDHSG